MKPKTVKKITKKPKKSLKKPNKSLSEVTTDEFLNQEFDDDDDDNTDNEKNEENHEEAPQNNDSDSDEDNYDPKSHKKSLEKLKETDPEFWEYLKQNDRKLLKFDIDEEDDNLSEFDDADKHVPDENLEIASDDDDYEPEETSGNVKNGSTKVTMKLLKSWEEELQNDKSSKTIKSVVEAFHSALLTVEGSDSSKEALQYRVEGSAAFNGIVQLCVLHLPNAFRKFLKITKTNEKTFETHKLKRFPKIKGTLKNYLADLLRILMNVTSPDILTVLLKHLHQMIVYTQSFSSLDKPLLKILLKLWSSGEETVRVVAFLNILRIATTRKESLLETLYKSMYIKYVENSKFVSPNSLSCINFMRHSLVEIYMLNPFLAYNHGFLYIRQLAIHLRNAMTMKKKEHFQAVYNWEYINSLNFWTDLIKMSTNQSPLRSLLYPLVQIITGTIKLIPTAQFYPLRFHCIQMLIDISKETGTFIPVLPLLLEVLNGYDFNKKHKSVTMKPISFICVLRMSKAQLQENGFKDSVIENIYRLILENAAKDSHMIYFPDLYVPCVVQLKLFLKNCKVANFCRKIKQLLDKIQENRQFIETERNKIIVDLSDMATIRNWENKLKNQGTPAAKFYESWFKIYQVQKLKLITKNEEMGSDYKHLKVKKRTKNGQDHDSDLEIPVEEMDRILEKQKQRKNKNKKQKVHEDVELPTDNNDIVRDMKMDDWD